MTATAVIALVLPSAAMADSNDVTVKIVGPKQARTRDLVTYKMYVTNNNDQPIEGGAGIYAHQDWGATSKNRQLNPQLVSSNVKLFPVFATLGLAKGWSIKIAPHKTMTYVFRLKLGALVSYQLLARGETHTTSWRDVALFSATSNITKIVS